VLSQRGVEYRADRVLGSASNQHRALRALGRTPPTTSVRSGRLRDCVLGLVWCPYALFVLSASLSWLQRCILRHTGDVVVLGFPAGQASPY